MSCPSEGQKQAEAGARESMPRKSNPLEIVDSITYLLFPLVQVNLRYALGSPQNSSVEPSPVAHSENWLDNTHLLPSFLVSFPSSSTKVSYNHLSHKLLFDTQCQAEMKLSQLLMPGY
jgi:hypothetical protein